MSSVAGPDHSICLIKLFNLTIIEPALMCTVLSCVHCSRLEMGVPEQQRESSLKYQTRALAAFPDGAGYALGSVEGRVAMEFIDMSPQAQANKYAFKVCTSSNCIDTAG